MLVLRSITKGGVQPYLQYIFGDVFGFLAAWTWIVAVMPATLAILSIVFVESIYSAIGVTDQAGNIEHKLFSILILVVISVANSISTKASTRLNNFFVITKFITIAALVLAGIVVAILQATDPQRDIGGRDWFQKSWFGNREVINPDGSKTDWNKLGEWEILGHYSAALYGALWAYSGWDKVSRHPYLSCPVYDTLTNSYRQSTSQPNFVHRPVSCRSPSTPLSPPSYSASSLPMPPITFCCHGTLSQPLIV